MFFTTFPAVIILVSFFDIPPPSGCSLHRDGWGSASVHVWDSFPHHPGAQVEHTEFLQAQHYKCRDSIYQYCTAEYIERSSTLQAIGSRSLQLYGFLGQAIAQEKRWGKKLNNKNSHFVFPFCIPITYQKAMFQLHCRTIMGRFPI